MQRPDTVVFLLYNKYRGREKIPAPFFKEMVIVSGIPL